jgi:hypothetical protein
MDDKALAEPAWCDSGGSAEAILRWHRAGFKVFWR